jgi:hypothetical protein
MGGFSSQVQQSQASQPSGKGGVNPVDQTLPQQAIPGANQVAQSMPQSGGGKGSPVARSDGLDQNAINANPQGFQQWQQQRSQQPTQYSPPDGTMGGKGSSTNSATSGQPRMGQPNRYANTIPQWDNASQQLGSARSGGKGKGG